jgi:hypothetical protein
MNEEDRGLSRQREVGKSRGLITLKIEVEENYSRDIFLLRSTRI